MLSRASQLYNNHVPGIKRSCWICIMHSQISDFRILPLPVASHDVICCHRWRHSVLEFKGRKLGVDGIYKISQEVDGTGQSWCISNNTTNSKTCLIPWFKSEDRSMMANNELVWAFTFKERPGSVGSEAVVFILLHTPLSKLNHQEYKLKVSTKNHHS